VGDGVLEPLRERLHRGAIAQVLKPLASGDLYALLLLADVRHRRRNARARRARPMVAEPVAESPIPTRALLRRGAPPPPPPRERSCGGVLLTSSPNRAYRGTSPPWETTSCRKRDIRPRRQWPRRRPRPLLYSPAWRSPNTVGDSRGRRRSSPAPPRFPASSAS